MTRESKLALILSFVLILVVGVLVSDYLSQANNMDPETLGPIPDRTIVQLPDTERDRTNNMIERALSSRNTEHPTPHKPGPDIIANRSSRSNSLLDELSDGLSRTIDGLRSSALASPVTSPTLKPATRPLGEITRSTYTVQEGDSLYQIAEEKLGNGNRWVEIQRLNADKVASSGIINPGMILKLPDNAGFSTPVLTSNNATNASTDHSETYTVASGDTLGEISFRLLGTSHRMDDFVTLNNLEDANDIRVGMKLKVPAQ